MPRRTSLIRKISSIGAVIALAATLGACAGDEAPAESTMSEAPAESTISFAIEGANLSSGHMDIHSSQLDVASLVLRNAFDSLVAQDASGAFVPWLASSWTISEDEL